MCVYVYVLLVSYFPGYYAAELVSAPGQVWTAPAEGLGPVIVSPFDGTNDEMRTAASWAILDYGSTRRMSQHCSSTF